jgi:hypothetical protein
MTVITVQVWNKPCEINVRQKSKSVWVATGTYAGETIQITESSYGAAIKRWREAATDRGN